MARKTAGSAGSTWDKEGELNGIYVEKKTNVGAHMSNVYIINTEGDTMVQVWGSTVLDNKFQEIPIGSEVWVECLGETTSKKGTKYVDYNVEYDDELVLAEQGEEQQPTQFGK